MVKPDPTFLDLPSEFSRYETSRCVLLPIPFDATSTFMKGADKGPRALIEASAQVELFDIETRREPYRQGIYTGEPIFSDDPEKLQSLSYARVKELLAGEKFVVTVGGEHSISFGPIRAHAEKFPNLTVLQFDAHTDLRDSYHGSKWNHACIMSRVRDLEIPTVAVGIRSMDKSEWDVCDKQRTFFAHEMQSSFDFIDRVMPLLSSHVYVTFDLDAFDPAIMPSTGTPEPGGMSWYQVTKLLRRVCEERTLVGCDIVELCPAQANKGPDFIAAKLVYKILAYRHQD